MTHGRCPVLNNVYTGECCLCGVVKDLLRCLELEAPVRAEGVVHLDGVRDGVPRLRHRGKGRVEIEFIFEDAVDAFGDGILIAVIGIGHAREHAMRVKLMQIFVTTVLAAAIRVMDDALGRTERVKGVVQRDERRVMREIAAEMPADYPTGEEIGDKKEIGKAVPRESEIRDVADHDLARGGDRHHLYQIWRDGVVMSRIRRLRVPALPLYEAVVCAQHREEMIAAHGHALRR